MKRRTFLAASAAALGASHEVAAQSKNGPGNDGLIPLDPGNLGQDPIRPCREGGAILGPGEVSVTGSNGVNYYFLSTTEEVRNELIAIFDDALSQLPAHIEFGPGDLRLLRRGLTIDLPRGARGLSLSGNGTRIRLTGGLPFEGFWHCLRLRTDTTGIDPAVGEVLPDADYFSDLSVRNLTFYDDDPAVHADTGVEETHGINLQWIRNARITNCVVDNVGDEGIELDYCQNAVVANNTLINTTQQELGGGGAISIKQGCDNVSVVGNTIRDGGGQATYGIAIKIINPLPVRNITIAGNVISNMSSYGINIGMTGNGTNPGSELISSVSITGNSINGCGYGIAFAGSDPNGHTARGITVTGNVLADLASGGVIMSYSGYCGVNISDNSFEDISGEAILARGDELLFSNNNMSNVSGACILLENGTGASVTGGIYRGCGTGADALFDETIGYAEVSISDISVTDCQSPIVIRNIRQVSGCGMQSDLAGLVSAPKMIDIGIPAKGPASVSNNRLEDGCIEVSAGDCVVSGNQITHTRDPGGNALRILSSAPDCLVSGNHIAAHSSRFAIEVAGDDALVNGNHVSRSVNTILDTGIGNTLVGNKGVGS